MRLITNLVAASSWVVVAAASGAPLEELWVVDYNGPASEQDSANVLLDAGDGAVIVVGESAQSGFDTDIFAAKYAADGSLLWFNAWDSPTLGNDYGAAAALDASGNLHVAGYYYGGPAGITIAVLKYDPAGALLWWRNYWLTSGNASHIANAIAVDDTGHVYIAGYSSIAGTNGNTLLLKYDADGDLIWTRHYNGPANSWDQGRLLALDGAGNAIMAGRTVVSAPSNDDIGIWKYAPNGDLLWFRTFGPAVSTWDAASGIAIGPDDSVHLAGWGRPGGNGTELDAVILKYDADGTLEWESWYAGAAAGEDQFHAMTVDDAGNTYATGASFVDDYSRQFLTVKVDASGVQQWVRLFGEPIDASDEATQLVIDDAGNVLVGGSSSHLIGAAAGDGGPPTDEGFRFVSYAPDGTERYESFHTLGGGHYLSAVVALPDGEIVATGGYYTKATQSDYFVAKWTELVDCNGNGLDDADDISNGTSEDCNGNGVPDECDIATGFALDCNHNDIPDSCDIDDGTLTDADASGVADECEAIGDLDGDGAVTAADLGILLGAWGRCDGCPADLDGDGVIGAADLAILLSNWG
ncbi:MAG: hypothetical protein KDA25_08720 [Phycisphaerales bacterium]|nr:hypothetical protein [Phycisphaerales bacterium]